MRFLLDENVPVSVLRWIRESFPEHSVEHIIELGVRSIVDTSVFEIAQQLDSVLITYDSDFSDLRVFPTRPHSGIVRLRAHTTDGATTIRILSRVIPQLEATDPKGHLFIADEKRTRQI